MMYPLSFGDSSMLCVYWAHITRLISQPYERIDRAIIVIKDGGMTHNRPPA